MIEEEKQKEEIKEEEINQKKEEINQDNNNNNEHNNNKDLLLLQNIQQNNLNEVNSIDISVVMGVTYALMKEYIPDIVPNWHSASHIRFRENIRQHISQLILQRRPNSTGEWLEKLIEVSHKVEERLYYNASSFEDYLDLDTLVERVVMVVNSTITEGKHILESEPSNEDSASEEEDSSKQSNKDDLKFVNKKQIVSRQVSSQGCSRVFIVKVLASVSEFVSGKLLPSIFTFPKELVVAWLQKAKEACSSSSLLAEEEYYGGPPFVADDPSTHWTEPHQLYTWWKNNVERKVKYKVLQEDATYGGPDQRRAARARWCAVIVSLAEVIRCSSGSTLQTKTLGTALNSQHPDPTKDNCILTPDIEQRPDHQFGMFPYGLPSFQYPMGTSITSNQFSRIRSGFKNMGINAFVPRPIGDIVSSPMIKSIIPSSDNRSSEADDTTTTTIPTQLPSVPQLLLADRHNLTSSSAAPANGYFVRHLPSWNGDDLDISKIIRGQTPKLSSTWKDISEDASSIQRKPLAKDLRAQSQSQLQSHLHSSTLSNLSSIPSMSLNSTSSINQINSIHQSSKGFQQAFPLKLFDLVTEQNNDIIGWLPEGNAFKVRHMENFVTVILPAYFKHANFTSFQRQLNLYGFRRTKESEKGAYYHSHFLAGRRDLAAGIRRVLSHHPSHSESGDSKIKFENGNSNGNNDDDPNNNNNNNNNSNGNYNNNYNGGNNNNGNGNGNNNNDNRDGNNVNNNNNDNNSNNNNNNNDNNNNNNNNKSGNSDRSRSVGEFTSLHGPRRNSAAHKLKNQKSQEKSLKDNNSNTSKPTKENITHSLLVDAEPQHDYGTRRKRQKKQNNEYSDDTKRTRKNNNGNNGNGNNNNNSGDIDGDNDDEEEQGDEDDEQDEEEHNVHEIYQIPNSDVVLPLVYVSGLNTSQDCDEVIDMTTLPNQRRRLTSRRILIDMTPVLNGRPAVISESQPEYSLSRKRSNKLSKDDSNSFYSNILSNVSHSKYTRVGDEYQAVIPELCERDKQVYQQNNDQSYKRLDDETYRLSRLEIRRKEQKFLEFSTSQVIVAVIPNSTTKKSRKLSSPPPCILSDIYNRTQLLEKQFISPPECFMSVELKNTLFPRLCVTLRTFKLTEREKTISDEHPVLYFTSLDENQNDNDNEDINNRIIESPLWGCEYLLDDDSDSDIEWKENDPRIKDMSSIIQHRYTEFDLNSAIYLEVTDGIQNWIVPWSVCAAAGSIDYEEYFLNQINSNSLNTFHHSKDDNINFSLAELKKLSSIEVSMNEYFIQISPALKKSNENISKAWRELQSSQGSNIWPTNIKDFIFFCHRYCPHPNDSSSACDSRVVAMRRLINMTSDLEIAPRLHELLTNEKEKEISLKQHFKSLSNMRSKFETDSDEEDIQSDTERILNLMEIQESHRPITRRSLIQYNNAHRNEIKNSKNLKNENSENKQENKQESRNDNKNDGKLENKHEKFQTDNIIPNKSGTNTSTITTTTTTKENVTIPSSELSTQSTTTSSSTTASTNITISSPTSTGARGVTTRSGAARRKSIT